MKAAEELLAGYLRGDQDAHSFYSGIEALLIAAPDTEPEVIAVIQRACQRGELPAQFLAALSSRTKADPSADTRLSSGKTGSDETLVRDRQTSPPANDDATLLRTGPAADSRATGRPTGPHTDHAWDSSGEWVAAADQPLQTGTTIKGRFVLGEPLGSGGMGIVFQALDLRRQEAQDRHPHVAIKFLNEDFRHHPESLKALQRESTKAQDLAHPNIVTVHDFDRDGALIYMTMEHLDGRPLDRMLREDHPGGMDFDQAWPIIDGAGQALSYAHARGIVHSDFKPGNVFVLESGRVKVLDFGIARAVSAVELNTPDATVFDAGSLGALTPAYASPEMHINLDPDPRDDVYALACVTYELLTGRHPFEGLPATTAQHRKLSPKRIKGLSRRRMKAIEHGLAFVREDRTASIAQFLDELSGPAAVARSRRAFVLVLLGMIAAVLTAVSIGGIWWATRPDPGELFVDRVLQQAAAAAPADHEVDTRLRDVLLEQGADYLELADAEFSPALLSEGVSSAYGAFQGALKMDPGSRSAAEGILKIVRSYETEAQRRIDAGDLAGSLEIAGYGLRIDPENDVFRAVRDEAQAVGND